LTSDYYKYLVILTPVILIFTKVSNKFLMTNEIGMKYFIDAATDKKEKRKLEELESFIDEKIKKDLERHKRKILF